MSIYDYYCTRCYSREIILKKDSFNCNECNLVLNSKQYFSTYSSSVEMKKFLIGKVLFSNDYKDFIKFLKLLSGYKLPVIDDSILNSIMDKFVGYGLDLWAFKFFDIV